MSKKFGLVSLLALVLIFGSFLSVKPAEAVVGPSNIATISSLAYTISAGGTQNETITNILAGTSKATFLSNLSKNEPNQNWDDSNLSDPVATGEMLKVTASDNHAVVYYTVTVNPPVNSAPTDIVLSSDTVPENSSTGTVVGTLSATDPDAGDTFTYSIVTPGVPFQINGGQLEVGGAIDYEATTSIGLIIRVTDTSGLPFDKLFTINITDVNETAVDFSVLASIITPAQTLHDGAIEGIGPEQYPLPLKANFQTAIDTASAVATNAASTQSEVDNAVTVLNSAVATFEAGRLPPNGFFLSEYVEGTSFNKAIEIYNGTGADIDLSAGGYKIAVYTNGSISATNINLSGTISNGDIFVLCHPSFDLANVSRCDQLSNLLTFNGNDAVALNKGTIILDVIGQIGSNPGTEWGVGLTSTKDHTLTRKCSVHQGDRVENDSFDPATEWDGYTTNTFTDLGVYSCDVTAPIITIDPYNMTPTNQDITVTATVNEGNLNFTSYTFVANGSFDFVATDSAGNISTSTVMITNIDKAVPVITIDPYITAPTNQDITVTATANEGTLNADSHTFTANGSFDFVATDSAGNISTSTVMITNIDKTTPITTIPSSSGHGGQGYVVGWGPTILVGTTTGQVLGTSTSRYSDLVRQRRLNHFRRRLLQIKYELLLIEHPELRGLFGGVVASTSTTTLTSTTDNTATTSVTKPFWRIW